MDKQNLFNTAVLGLASQDWRKAEAVVSRNINLTACRYRAQGADGRWLKCAIGWCVPDALYRETFENYGSINSLLNSDGTDAEEMAAILGVSEERVEDERTFLAMLQDCHDGAATPENMRNALRALAMREHLTLPEPLTRAPHPEV